MVVCSHKWWLDELTVSKKTLYITAASGADSALNGFNVGFASDDYGYFVPYRKGAAHPARWRGSTCRPYRRCGCWT